MGNLRCGCSPFIYRDWACEIFNKMFKIMSTSNVYRPFACNPQSPYISLINYSIDVIMLIGQIY